MIDIDNMKNFKAFNFSCEHCGKEDNIFDYLHRNEYGTILLNGKNDGYFGKICQKCKKTTLKKCSSKFINILKRQIKYAGLFFYNTYLGSYDSFPFTLDYHGTAQPNVIDYQATVRVGRFNTKPIRSNRDLFHEPSEGYCSYLFDEPIIDQIAMAVWWYKDENLEDLVNIENNTGLKVFPRYVSGNRVFDDIPNFCVRYHLKYELGYHLYKHLSPKMYASGLKDNPSNPKINEIMKNFEFLKILSTFYITYYYKRGDHWDNITPSRYRSKKILHEQTIEKLCKNFSNENIQELLCLMSTNFIFDYIDLSKKTDFSLSDRLIIKYDYWEKLYESTKSRYKGRIAKYEELEKQQEKVKEAEKQFPNVNIISDDHKISQIKIRIAQIAKFKKEGLSFLLLGERGTGKDLFARAIHEASGREGNFIKVDCGTKSETLFESKLFGHVKGAFTGADRTVTGAFEEAENGTIFLDEIGNLAPNLQDILLNPIQDLKYQPVGSSKTKEIRNRFIYATNANFEEMVQNGKFRSDLYDRINFFPIHIPPLRERKGDIPLLVKHFIEKHDTALETVGTTGAIQVNDECMNLFKKYDWPGNVRELENTITRIILDRLADEDRSDITPSDLPVQLRELKKGSRMFSMNEEKLPGNMKVTDEQVIYWMKKLNNNKSQVAKQFSVSYRTILRHCKKLNL